MYLHATGPLVELLNTLSANVHLIALGLAVIYVVAYFVIYIVRQRLSPLIFFMGISYILISNWLQGGYIPFAISICHIITCVCTLHLHFRFVMNFSRLSRFYLAGRATFLIAHCVNAALVGEAIILNFLTPPSIALHWAFTCIALMYWAYYLTRAFLDWLLYATIRLSRRLLGKNDASDVWQV